MKTPMALLVPVVLVAHLVGCSESELSVSGDYQRGWIGDIGGDEEPGPASVGSGSLSLTLTEPLPGGVVTTQKIPVKGRATGVSSVLVNGDMVAVVDGLFEHAVNATGEGPQGVEVVAEGLPKLLVPIIVDLTAPRLDVFSPPRGAFLSADEQRSIRVSGVAADASGVEAVTVNGQRAPVSPDGSFSLDLEPKVGTNIFEIEVTDGGGKKTSRIQSVVYGRFAPWGRPSDDAVTARLGVAAIGTIEKGLVGGIGSSLAGGLDLGGTGDEEIEILGMSYGSMELELVPQQGYFNVKVLINDLVIEIATEQNIFSFDVTVTGEVKANPAELNGRLELRPDGAGSLEMDLSDVGVELHDFELDLDGLAGIVDGLVESTVEDMATEMLLEVLNGGGLDLVGSESGPAKVDILGQEADLSLLITQLDIDPQGMTFGTDALFELPASSKMPSSPGTLQTSSQPPVGSGDKMVRLSLSDDFVNQILGSVWRSGALNIDVGQALAESEEGLAFDLTAGTFALLVGDEILAHTGPDSPVGLKLRPLLPPVATVEDPEQGLMNVQVGDMMLDFSIPSPEGPVVWASVATHLDIDVFVSLGDDGQAQVEFELDARVDLAQEPLFDIDDEIFEGIILSMVKGLGDSLNEGGLDGVLGAGGGGLLGGGTGPAITSMRVSNDGSGADFMSFYVDLALD